MAVRRQRVEAAGLWEPSPSRRRRRWAVGEGEEEAAGEDCAVLTLSHFSRPPFVSFGTVRVGTSRARRLALENPNQEPVSVAVSRPPPPAKGFAVDQRPLLLQPRERVFISITWTPLESGKVRELITFVLNDVVQHQAVLLGTAEQPMKKKKSLWDTIKKRTPAQCKKRLPNIKTINKTFQISEKSRSPLQACENLEVKEGCISLKESPVIILANELSLSPISPVLQENQHVTYTPFSIRSSTNSTLETAVCDELAKETCKRVVKETCTDVFLGDSLVEPTLKNVHTITGSQSSNTDSACTPEQLRKLQIPPNHRRFLSPDSFVNNSYELLEEPVTTQTIKFLSPDQFLKECQIAVQTTSEMYKSAPSPRVESCLSRMTSPRQKKALQVVTFSGESKCPNKGCEERQDREFLVFHNGDLEQNTSFCPAEDKEQTSCFQKEWRKKRPVLSSTVIKNKPKRPEENGTEPLKPKSRKCLSNAVWQCTAVVPEITKEEMLPDLPVIEPHSAGAKCLKTKTASACLGPNLHTRKRKSGECLEGLNREREEDVENLGTKKILMSCAENEKQSAMKTSVLKSANGVTQSQKKRIGLSPKLKTVRKTTKNVVPVAQSQLTFVKPFKTGIPTHPMPFAAKNMFYDERWMEKQQRGFTWWLNFVLTPDDFTVKTHMSQVNAASLIFGTESQHKSSVPKAPTKEEVSLRAYTARVKLNKLRRSACCLFTGDVMIKAIKRLEIEIETRRLLVRKDRHLWKDIGERQKVLNWLLCYNPLWLRIGLETVYGELIALDSNSDVMGLAMFILNRLLWNPDIAAEYRHPTVPHLYREGHEEALSRFTLKKLLLLVCFLDRAKLSRIIDHDPCLFCKDAEFKSSKEILLAFSRDFLSGEGDLSRHLGFLGFPVNHMQTPLDEFDFAVTNLATDLQCGIRLVRALELLTKNWNLSQQLRVPAISRMQKIHNVKIVLQVLKDHLRNELGATIDPKDVVDRHKEKTLALLWKIVFTFQVDVAFDVDQLKDEINFLKNMHVRKAKTDASVSSLPTKVKKDSSSYSSVSYSENVNLLMEWVNAVCGFYNTKVENFTVSFSDGRALCYLIHHYHPCYVPLEAICQHTTQTVECTKIGSLAPNSSSESEGSLNLLNETFDQTITTSELYKELLDNEKRNFHLINAAVSDLGGVPSMIHHSDMSNTIPDEKVVIAFVSFLCSRLLSLCKEIRAARLIQSVWREYRLKTKLAQITRQRFHAAVAIQTHWRRYLAQKELWKLKKTKQEETERWSSIIIQTCWRRYCARKIYLQLRHYAIIMQARIRMLLAIAAYKRVCWAVLTIQRRFRASLKAKDDEKNYQNLKLSALVIQSAFRRWHSRRMMKKMEAEMRLQAADLAKKERAAVVIQSWYRMTQDRNNYLGIRRNVIKIQTWCRCIQAKFVYEQKKASALTIQKYYRAYRLGKLEREAYVQKYAAIVCLQSAFKGMKGRILYQQIRAACVLQSFWRMRQERLRFLHVKCCVIVVQSHVRKHQQLKRYQRINNAVRVIQARYRANVACKKAVFSYQKLCHSAVILQSAFRARQARKEFNLLKSVVKIQSYFRAYVAQKRFLNLKRAVVKIQSFMRMRQACKRYCALKEATICVQRRYRSQKYTFQLQAEYKQLRSTCIQVQAVVRGNLVRNRVRRWQKAAVVLQAWYRMARARQCFLKMSGAATVIQVHYCAYREQTVQRQKFLQAKKAAVCLQATYRGYRLRHMLKCQHMAAVKIQAAFRAHAARRKYQATIQASLAIQRWYRAFRIRTRFLKTKRAVTSLQAASRGWRVRKQIREQHAAATVMQSAFRRYTALTRFRMMRNAALTLQQRYRANISARKQRREYLVLWQGIVQLQAAWRGTVVRKQMQRQHQAAVVIQAYYRMHVSQNMFKRFRGAAVQIQRWYRAVALASCQRQEYLALKKATIKMQAIYRGLRERRKIERMHQAAVCIEAMFKMHRSHIKYQAMKTAATIIQRRYRAYCRGKREQQHYRELRESVLILQAAYRGMKVRQELKILHQSVIAIQSFYRMYRQQKYFQKVTIAAKLIQQWYCGCRARNAQVYRYKQMKAAAVRIQSAFRGMKTRRCLKKMHVAASTIQRQFRTSLQRRRFLSLKVAAVTLQRRYRAAVLSKQQREKYLSLCQAAIIMQGTFRGQLVRKHVKQMQVAATTIQAAFRMHIAYSHYQTVKLAYVTIQRHYRAHREAKYTRETFLKWRRSAVVLQAAFRGLKTRRILKKQHDSATVIQSNYRMHIQECSYKKMQWAAKVIQTRFRANKLSKLSAQQYSSVKRATSCIQKSFHEMKAKEHQKRHQAAIVLQRSFRKQRVHRKYLTLKAAAVLLQRRYRALILARRQTQEYLRIRAAVICLQSFYRSFKIRKEVRLMNSAARVVQATFRMHRARLSFRRLKSAAVTIEKHYRSYQKRKQQNTCLAIWKSAVVIQVASSSMKAQEELKAMCASATVIQSFYRMHVQRKNYKRISWAVITIQSAYRGMVARQRARKECDIKCQSYFHVAIDGQKLIQLGSVAIELQTQYDGNEVRLQHWKSSHEIQQHDQALFATNHQRTAHLRTLKSIVIAQATIRGFIEHQKICRMKSAIKIQRWYRAKLQRRKYLQYREKIIKLQRIVRRWMSCRKVPANAVQKNISQENLNGGITKFQALWRGYFWRKKTDTIETRALRDSLLIANKESSEEKKLCNRTSLAIDRLLKYKHFSYILTALKDLEVVTRLSPVCCESMAQSEAVITIFTLIRSCNRSVPCMEVIRYSVQVLLNMSKYDRTTEAVYVVENSVDTLLNLLQMYREKSGDKISEKGGSIFTKTCCLLALLSKDSGRAFAIRSSCQVVARLRSLFKLTARKHQMDTQRMLARQKRGAYARGHFSIPTPIQTKIVTRQRPDWVLRKDNMQEIVDPLQAIQMVMDTLGISYQ